MVAADISSTNFRETVGHSQTPLFAEMQLEVDVSEDASVGELVSTVMDRYGRIDVLFNNAAVGPSAGRPYTMANVADTPPEAWDAILSTNLKGAGLVSRAVIPHMVKAGFGVIINNASINGLVAVQGADAYTASKGGLIALTRAMAVEWAPFGLRVNCICPGPIDTAMNAPYLENPDRLRAMKESCPMGRVATAEEVASVAVFLSGDGASYVNGAILPVDGGWTAV